MYEWHEVALLTVFFGGLGFVFGYSYGRMSASKEGA